MNNDYKNNDEENMNESHFDAVMKRYQDVHMNPEEKREVFKQTMLVIEKIEAVSLAHSDLHKAIRPTSAFVEDESLIVGHDGTTYRSIQNAHNHKGLKRVASVWISYIKQRQFIPALLTAVVFLFTGGASVLAERSLPGDSLYGVKINVNESIREFATVGTEAKAKLAVEATGRRLQEAAVLSASGKLDESNKKILQDQFSKNVSQVRNQVASLSASNEDLAAAEISETLEITLGAYSKTLDTLAGGDATSTVPQIIDINVVTPTSTDPTTIDGAGSPITPINSAPITVIVVASPTAPTTIMSAAAAPSTAVNSLLQAVRAELDTAKTARLGIEAEANAAIALRDDQPSTTTKAIIDSMIQGIRFTLSDINAELDAHKFDPKAFVYAPTTIEFAKKRAGDATSTVEEMISLSKNNSYAEAIKKGRATSRSLSEVLVILKIEKSTKGTLDSRVNITSLIQNGFDDVETAGTN
jgi:hypothetical protein